MGMADIIRDVGGRITDIIKGQSASAGAAAEAQSKINEAEISGAPQSGLRLWRSFLGWCLALCFMWEVIARPIITTYLPDVQLPPSFLKEITALLLSLLGL